MDYNKMLKDHRKKFGTSYRLPSGQHVFLKDNKLTNFLKENKLQLHEPSYQGSNEKEAQTGIKHA